MSAAPFLELRHVRRVYGGRGPFGLSQREVVALNDFSLTIDEANPSIVAVVGESGSGKTTMARLLLGLETPTSGVVLYRGTELQKL
jgi:ABC-type oligopeptide transport system ATPase subunit